MGLGHTWHGQCLAYLVSARGRVATRHTRVCQVAGIVLSVVLSLVCTCDTCAFTVEERMINGRMLALGGSGQGVHWTVLIVVANFQ